MSYGILSHTFAQTHALTLVSRQGERRHYRTDDGRDILAKPSTNPAYADGLCYWQVHPWEGTSSEIASWLSGRIG